MLTDIIQYENGDMPTNDIGEFFSRLIKTGTIFSLQGHYQRTAARLVEDGVIDYDGTLLASPDGVGKTTRLVR